MKKVALRKGLTMTKRIKCKNGYIDIVFPLRKSVYEEIERLSQFMLEYERDEGLEKKWAKRIRTSMDKMFGKGAYYKVFGGDTASLLQVGEFFEKLNHAVDECHEELRKEINKIKAVTNENLI